MVSLANLQAEMRHALVAGRAAGIAPFIVGGGEPLRRLAIHQRHYESSLVTVLVGKFPACVWLLGSTFMQQAARDFVRASPPHRPCLAEYGDNFPSFLASYEGGTALPYLRSFAELEWLVGEISIAIGRPALTWPDIARVGPDALPDAVLTLQPGVQYLQASWAVDDLMRLYLTDTSPAEFELASGDVWLELTGARGELDIHRVDQTTFAFRNALREGRSLTCAAEQALQYDAAFDAGAALADLVEYGLVTAVTPSVEPDV